MVETLKEKSLTSQCLVSLLARISDLCIVRTGRISVGVVAYVVKFKLFPIHFGSWALARRQTLLCTIPLQIHSNLKL